MPKRDYLVLVDRWIGTTFFHAGDPVSLTDAAAQYLLLDGSVDLIKPAVTHDDAAEAGGGKRRSDRD
ncbi:hypothetical protein ACJ4V0_15590 [Phreatobacter sp. HK31-P]